MEEIKHYLTQFQKADTQEVRVEIIKRYQEFLKTLSDEDQDLARQFMKIQLQPSIYDNLKELDALVEKANLVLKGKITYEGREYILGDWVTIADYCRLYNFKPSRVQNWIDREIVPRQNVVIIQELNNLKLLKNVVYRP